METDRPATARKATKPTKATKATKPTTSVRTRVTASGRRDGPEADGPAPDPRVGRVFVEAFDRLADRLLERIRSLRQDVDTDLASVRSELAALRQSVDAIGDRVQLRHLRTTLDEVHGDVIGLRRAVLEWPELDQVAADVTAVREELAALRAEVAELKRQR